MTKYNINNPSQCSVHCVRPFYNPYKHYSRNQNRFAHVEFGDNFEQAMEIAKRFEALGYTHIRIVNRAGKTVYCA